MSHPRAATRVLPELDIEAACDWHPADTPPGAVLQQWHDGEGRLVASGGREGERWWMHWPGLATYTFGVSGAVRARPARAGLDERVADSFTRGVAPIVMLARGYEALHASAVSDERGVIVLCAQSGTGKSTLALALSTIGLRHWADDTVAYHLPGGDPVAVRLPCPVRVEHSARHALGDAPVETDTAAERAIRGVFLLVRDDSVDPASPRIARVDGAARLERLLVHAHTFDLDGDRRRRQFMQSLLALAASVQVHECRFGPSLEALPTLARAVRAHAEAA